MKIAIISIPLYLVLHITYVHCAILTPPYFNLVSGKKIHATATCGEYVSEPELYCKLTGTTATEREQSQNGNLISVHINSDNQNIFF